MSTSPEPDWGGADRPGDATALLGELTTAHGVAHELAASLAAELADCDDRLVETRTVVDAVVRHATDAIAVIDRDLRVHFASAAAVELLTDVMPTGSTLSLVPALPPGGAAEARRYLVPEPPGDWRNPPVLQGPDAVELEGRLLHVTVARAGVRANRGGGLWGQRAPSSPSTSPADLARHPCGVVTLRLLTNEGLPSD